MITRIVKSFIFYLYAGSDYHVKQHIRIILYTKKHGLIKLANFFSNRMQRKYGVFISPRAVFDNSLNLRHPVGIVIGEGVRLGRKVTIYQNVTIGGARLGDAKLGSYPEIGDGTVIFAGAVLIGNIKIGSNSVIGANAVVTKDVPDRSVAVGVPARIVKENEYE